MFCVILSYEADREELDWKGNVYMSASPAPIRQIYKTHLLIESSSCFYQFKTNPNSLLLKLFLFFVWMTLILIMFWVFAIEVINVTA